MQQSINNFQKSLKSGKIHTSNKHLKETLEKFDFIYYEDIDQIDERVKHYQNNSGIVVIDECIQDGIKYYVVCFDYKLIIFPKKDKTESSTLRIEFSGSDLSVKYFIQGRTNQNNTNSANTNFFNEIKNFSQEFMITDTNLQHFWKKIVNCVSGFLIKKGYQNSRNKHDEYHKISKEKFVEYKEEKASLSNKSYIEIRILGRGSGGIVKLIYHIDKEEIFAMKIPFIESIELNERERNNYLNFRHEFIVPYIGYIECIGQPKYLLLEYIEGETLDKYNLSSLKNQQKYIIIFELLLTIKYLHLQGYIYRDFRFSNIIINQNKDATLIDFDRVRKMKNGTDSLEEEELQTKEFNDQAVAPENNKTYKSDVYSLGYIIHFILYGKSPKNDNDEMVINEDFVFKSSLNTDPTKRSNIFEMMDIFYSNFLSEIILEYKKHYLLSLVIQKDPQTQFNLGLIYHEGLYVERDIDKAIHHYSLAANQNYKEAQCNLGRIYYEGQYVTRDINKAIHYYSLAAKQNDLEAQFNLGVIYYGGQYFERDINKAIYYYSLAANQNYPQAQYNLGLIYSEGKYVTRDINKAIHYYSLAASQNIIRVHYNLGLIYSEGKYVTRDIKKAIHHYSLGANQNDPKAQYNLGAIYYNGQYVTRDIKKAIHYFLLAANQNILKAQYNLGLIYSKGQYVTRDINKAIHYLSLAANQNDPDAQYNLGLIYSKGQYVTRDINKAIHYLSLAANQNDPDAQYILGAIYYNGQYVTRDIDKAIHYYSLAANQNYPNAQYCLGLIYSEGRYVTRDINKAIHYLSLAANQDDPDAQCDLGAIYYEGQYVERDIDKAIHYFSLAANQNYPNAQCNLGIIYKNGKYVKRDINKAIHYYSLSANQNCARAQFNLGLIYIKGKYVKRDIKKAIHYLSLAANQNYPYAQFELGLIYLGDIIDQDIKKSIYYIILASKNNIKLANYMHAVLLHEGIYIKKDIKQAIHYYKEASSFNIQFSKNNLGIIYKHGYDDIKGNVGNAIVFFEEAIRQKNDYLSMYNLSHIYIYMNDTTNKQEYLNKSIELLIQSMNKFEPSFTLLQIALLLRFDFNIEQIKQELVKRTDLTIYSINKLFDSIDQTLLDFGILYELYQSKDYLYNFVLQPILSSEMGKQKVSPPKYPNAKDLSSEFYKGFGEDLYSSF